MALYMNSVTWRKLMSLSMPLSGVLTYLLLAGCAALPYQGTGFRSGYVQVRQGETLYSIAWRFDLDYQRLARWNGLRPPYTLTPGQWLRMNPPGHPQTMQTGTGRTEIANAPAAQQMPGHARPYRPASAPRGIATQSEGAHKGTASGSVTWMWPTQGKIARTYTDNQQGIEIAGKLGQPVVAAASGQVVYSGDGLPSYGNLIIIKHNGTYLSAYGHNKKLLVKEGDIVKRGETIALMGETGTGITQPMLFFEIRLDGNPVNPILYLPIRANH